MLPRGSGRSQAFLDAHYPLPFFSAEVKDMIGSSQSEVAEVLRKRDLVGLREMLKNWSPSALVQLMTELPLTIK